MADGGSTDIASTAPFPKATAIAVGEDFACCTLDDGTSQCWGHNSSGQLGNGKKPADYAADPALEAYPDRVKALQGAISMSAGRDHACARSATGVACWGGNQYGQIGDGKDGLLYGAGVLAAEFFPAQVSDLKTTHAVGSGDGFGCALRSDTIVACWGRADHGELGSGPGLPSSAKPVLVKMPSGSLALAVGGHHACAVKKDGSVHCWGDNSNGQVTGTPGKSVWLPQQVEGVAGAVTLAAGERHSCAGLADGSVTCWGASDRGQVGVVAVSTPATAVGALAKIKALAAGRSHTCALSEGGQVHCWGAGDHGQLGSGDLLDRATPAEVFGLTAVALAAGGDTTCAIDAAGKVACWGAGSWGRLGNGAVSDAAKPVNVVWTKPAAVGSADAGSLDGGPGDGAALTDVPDGDGGVVPVGDAADGTDMAIVDVVF